MSRHDADPTYADDQAQHYRPIKWRRDRDLIRNALVKLGDIDALQAWNRVLDDQIKELR